MPENPLTQWAAPMFCLLLIAVDAHASENNPLALLEELPQASLLALDGNANIIANIAPDQARTPASTIKILTAWLAIEYWGLEHRFHTDFYVDSNQHLWVKGYGDPFLISEEIDLMTQELRNKGLEEIRGVHLDNQYFSNTIRIDGQSNSDNPYDAPLAALAANFNTLYLKRTPSGIESAESQTPITAVAKKLGATIKGNKARINIQDKQLATLYFGEILVEKLKARGVDTHGAIAFGSTPPDSQLFYRHYNSHKLTEVLQAMLHHSTNFIANQIFLMLGAEYYGAPATLEKAQRFANHQIASRFNWKGFHIQEGAGLSRKNRVTAVQFIELLQEFVPYRKLLPAEISGIHAKTGTLRNVSCYAGFIGSHQGPAPFVLFINSPAPHNYRLQIARELQQLVDSGE